MPKSEIESLRQKAEEGEKSKERVKQMNHEKFANDYENKKTNRRNSVKVSPSPITDDTTLRAATDGVSNNTKQLPLGKSKRHSLQHHDSYGDKEISIDDLKALATDDDLG